MSKAGPEPGAFVGAVSRALPRHQVTLAIRALLAVARGVQAENPADEDTGRELFVRSDGTYTRGGGGTQCKDRGGANKASR
ncbi:hypothetical protein EXIGLDRAFT_731096 [Exidia glandulosa HHB12029]|uniref:Uncharacterized protein n=1 Tax=Exidia glandulosa HHB12029 TaxID=1314781 RepID=A0A165L5V1_EXIGL|nr:hypothetical protein EXIGLDRAFT_731096 [Exidia glandulosa HHB12029]